MWPNAKLANSLPKIETEGNRANHRARGTEKDRKNRRLSADFKQLSRGRACGRSRREFAFASAMISASLPHTHRCRCIQSRVPNSCTAALRAESFAFTLAPHVGKMFCFTGIDRQIFRSRVFADDHSGIDVFLRTDEKPAAFLNVVERVSRANPTGSVDAREAVPVAAGLLLRKRSPAG